MVTAKKLRKPIHIDDLLTGVKSEQDALTLCAEANEIFRATFMKQRNWDPNSVRLNAMYQQGTSSAIPSNAVANMLKVLGLT